MAAGTLGGESQTYTLYGDTVNLAQRLEGSNKHFGTDCLVSGPTFEAARSACVDAVAMGPIQVRGRVNATDVYALDGPARR